MKILIAEDDAVSRRVLEGFLNKWGYDVLVSKDGEEAWQILQEEDAPQMAILDWMMPQMDGIEVCRRLRRRGPEPYVYVLLLTAKGQKRDVVEGIEAGADDYLTKPFDPGELQARLRAGRRILALQGALISARDALRFQATHDPLTGLFNRRYMKDSLDRELYRAKRHNIPFGLIMLDIDFFRRIARKGDVHARERTVFERNRAAVHGGAGRSGRPAEGQLDRGAADGLPGRYSGEPLQEPWGDGERLQAGPESHDLLGHKGDHLIPDPADDADRGHGGRDALAVALEPGA